MSDFHERISAVLSRYDTTSPSQLQDLTVNPDFSVACHSPSNMSPSQVRTMKDYEEQLGSLRKENFNLKLKVYFLEERLDASNSPNSQDDLLKKNIELKVNFEGLKKEINERQELLCAAARALELMEATAAQKENELQMKISSLEEELQYLRNMTKNDRTNFADNSAAIDINDGSIGLGADDSTALYMAAFNIPKFSISENQHKEATKINNVCECRQLRALLTAEREAATSLRNLAIARDKEILQQRKALEELNERLKQSEIDNQVCNIGNAEIAEKNVDHEQAVEKLKQENLNACQMIQGCLLRIKQVDKENKKLKLKLDENLNLIELTTENDSNDEGPQLLKKYKDMICARDKKIFELENQLKINNILKDSSNINNSSQNCETDWNWMNHHLEKKIDILRESISVRPDQVHVKNQDQSDEKENPQKNLVHILSSRLQEMAHFLDSLLSNRCILSEEKRRKVENLLEQSIELPMGLKLDPSTSQFFEDTCLDSSFYPGKQSMKLADLTRLFGHHTTLDDTVSIPKTSEYNTSNQNSKKDLHTYLQLQNEEIESLKTQLKFVKDRCICRSIEEDSDSKTDLNTKCNPFEYNKLIKKSKLKINKMNKYNLNTTWHGDEDFHMDQSESECWSEPDRIVSLARMGGPLEESNVQNCISSDEDTIDRCKSFSRESQNTQQTYSYSDECNRVSIYTDQIRKLMEEKNKIERSLEEANTKIKELENNLVVNKNQYNSTMKMKQSEINTLTQKLEETEQALKKVELNHSNKVEELITEKNTIQEKLKNVESQVSCLKTTLVKEQQLYEHKCKVLQNEIKDVTDASNLKIKEITDKVEINWVSRLRYDTLRRELDNAALQASQATLDRTVAAEQKMRSDTEAERLRKLLTETRLRISELENINAELQNRFVHMESWHNSLNKTLPFPICDSDSPQRATSPDQGIDSDRLSSLEINEPASSHDDYIPTQDLTAENALLRAKLERTQRTLESALSQLHAADYRKKKVQRAMCQEIHKTHSVLRQVRDNLTHYDS